MTTCIKRAFFIFFLLITNPLPSITVDLREPTFSEGVLQTDKGGVVTGPNIRIQARKILYTRQQTNVKLKAESDLIVEFGDYIFVGAKLEYDFEKNTGVLYYGRTGIEPWFIGGKEIHLNADASFLIYDGFATTSENIKTDWKIESKEASLNRDRNFSAKNVQFNLFDFSLFWVPKFRINLDSIFNSPFHYTVRFGGYERTRLGVSYDAFTWGGLKTRLNLDYRFARGLGGGINFDYKSQDHNTRYNAINYIARDVTLYNDRKRTRYRYSGNYSDSFEFGKMTVLASYDVLSDKEMATDYSDKGLKLESGERTQLEVRREERDFIVNFLTRIRVNDFQTVKEELPTITISFKPTEIASTGIISENRAKFSYLQLEFTEDRPGNHNFTSPRHEIYSNFYRPLNFGQLNFRPEFGFLAIYYGNSPEKFDRWLTLGLFELDINTHLYKFYTQQKHVITPYIRYQYYTYPKTPPKDHFIFDLDDGWYRLNTLRFGVKNALYAKTTEGSVYQKLYADIFLYSFFDTKTENYEAPKIYTRLGYKMTPFMTNKFNIAWDIQHNMLDHWNYELQWTISAKAALIAEYRHRSPYAWRKVDSDNFILDSFRSIEFLKHTEVSDRRDTFLLNLCYRFHPNWALNVQSRNGWNRKFEPNYNEFQIDLLGTFRSSMHLKISYRHKEEEKDRISFNFSIGLQKPKA